jgi:hypothetical protein
MTSVPPTSPRPNDPTGLDTCDACIDGAHDDHVAPCDCQLYSCTGRDFDPDNVTDRRHTILMMAADEGLFDAIGEEHQGRLVNLVAKELLHTSVALHQAQEDIETLLLTVKVLGAQTAGLVGLPLRDGLHDVDPESLEPGIDRMLATLYREAARR